VNTKLVICDVQPAYKDHIFFMKDFREFVSQYQEVLVLYVGPSLAQDRIGQVANYLMRHGSFKHKEVLNFKYFDKSYAFFRDMMDSGFDDDDIIKVVRHMIKKRVYDLRDVKNIHCLKVENLDPDRTNVYIPDLRWILPKWDHFDLCGGGREECLKEVELLSTALNLNFNTVPQFVYG